MQNIRWGHIGAGFVFGIVVNLGVAIVLAMVVSVFQVSTVPGVTGVVNMLASLIGAVAAGYHIARKTFPHGIHNLIALWCVLAGLGVLAVVALTLSGNTQYVKPSGGLTFLVMVPAHLLGFWIDSKRNHQIAPPPLPRS